MYFIFCLNLIIQIYRIFIYIYEIYGYIWVFGFMGTYTVLIHIDHIDIVYNI